MSEQILRAIIELLAIVAKEDDVTLDEKAAIERFLNENLSKEDTQKYMQLFEELTNKESGKSDYEQLDIICKQINYSQTNQQKVVIILNLLELVVADSRITQRENELMYYITEKINIDRELTDTIKAFVIYQISTKVIASNIVIVDDGKKNISDKSKHIIMPNMVGMVFILRIPEIEFYFCKYVGEDTLHLNGVVMRHNRVYVFPQGSMIKSDDNPPIFYSDVVSRLRNAQDGTHITFLCENVDFKFSNGNIGLRSINIAEEGGKLMALMGGSGAGKSTLLNVLNGIEAPSSGKVTINGIDIHQDQKAIEGVIGYIPQDDLLIEELTVFENLYFAAKLCFKDKKNHEITQLVNTTLESLGLYQARNLRVGTPLDKSISGGQRKRLNIGLELLREPSVLFVDEPTSGLSSRDSENIMDLLKELSLKGKMIFVVIHQPSEDIFKMFDKLILLDVGGYQIYYGNPVEAIEYFNTLANVVSGRRNANPEQIFNIIEAKIINEFGKFTNQRKVQPVEWAEFYRSRHVVRKLTSSTPHIEKSLNIPNAFQQLSIFVQRDVLSKISNKQYLLVNFLEAPFLAFILTFIIRYISPNTEIYTFKENQNIPVFFFMSVIVALFMGLTVSAEEIIRDRKILKRETFLHLNRLSYISSKTLIMFSISAIQTLTFVLISVAVLKINGMTYTLWLVLFSVSCFANILGLNVSSAFKSAVTVYVLIPLLIIPQLIMSGVVVNFDKLNPSISNASKVPLIGEIMASRWAYEALAVDQYKNNPYMRNLFAHEQKMAQSEYKTMYLIPRLKSKLDYVNQQFRSADFSENPTVINDLAILQSMLGEELRVIGKDKFPEIDKLTTVGYSNELYATTNEFMDKLKAYYNLKSRKASESKNEVLTEILRVSPSKQTLTEIRSLYENDAIGQLVKNTAELNRIIESDQRLIQKIYPIYLEKEFPESVIDFRAQFYAPTKHMIGSYVDTTYFNVLIIWMMSLLLLITLYYDVFRKMISGKKAE